jgi:methylthioribose-1-phosphate isomerase
MAGIANMLNRSTSAAAANLLGLGEPFSTRPQRTESWTSTRVPTTVAPAHPAEDTYRSPYRLAGETLVILDQRVLPGRFDELVARRGADVAYYLRLGAVRGGPLMAQLAAYGLALTAQERASAPAEAVERELQRTGRALTLAWPTSRLLAWAVQRMLALALGDGEGSAGPARGAALRAEADAIASELQVAQSAIADALVGHLPQPADRPLTLLLHGAPGALTGGLVGTAITALIRLNAEGRRLRVFVTETRPFLEGARLAAWELRQGGVGYQLIPDSAVAWLFERETVDAVLMDAEWIAANGDSAAVVGSRAVAQLAAAAPELAAAAPEPAAAVPATPTTRTRERPRVLVCGISHAFDPATADGSAMPAQLRPVRDLTAFLDDVPVGPTEALVPAIDVIPAGTITALVTERGILSPTGAASVASSLTAAAAAPSAVATAPSPDTDGSS